MIQLVLTDSGFVPIDEIEIGQNVYDRQGRPTKVKSIQSGIKNSYEVTLKPDITVFLHDEQEMFVEKSSWKWHSTGGFRTLKFKEFRESIPNKKKWNRYYSPVPDTIGFKDKKCFVHPYIMGSLLGDGGMTTNSIKFTSIDLESIELIEELLPDGHVLNQISDTVSFHLSYEPVFRENHVKDEMMRLGVMGKSSLQKEIHPHYLYNSTKKRLELLRGLMDTDGTISACGRKMSFTSSSKQLADDVKFLCRTLGGTPFNDSKIPFYRNEYGEKIICNESYRIHVKLPLGIIPFHLDRKKERISLRKKNNKTGKYYRPYQIFEEAVNIGEHLFVELEVESDSYIGNDFFVLKSFSGEK
jgi:hypothetical protein